MKGNLQTGGKHPPGSHSDGGTGCNIGAASEGTGTSLNATGGGPGGSGSSGKKSDSTAK